MKRAFQVAAMIVILLLGVQPALEGAACAMGGAMPTACPLCMSAMGTDCPMAQGMVDCCNRTPLKAVILAAIPAKPRSAAASSRTSTGLALLFSAVAPSRWLPVVISSPPPPFLFSRVFRI